MTRYYIYAHGSVKGPYRTIESARAKAVALLKEMDNYPSARSSVTIRTSKDTREIYATVYHTFGGEFLLYNAGDSRTQGVPLYANGKIKRRY